MMPTIIKEQAPVPPPCYQRAQARLLPALRIDALTLITTLHLLALCRLAARVANRRCPPPLAAGKGGAPRTYSEASLTLDWPPAYLVAFVVSRHARLAQELASACSGLWVAFGQTGTTPHSK